MKKIEVLELLAEHFTGPLVAHHSICLQVGNPHATMAKRFFDTREKLGIRGYADKAESAAILKAALR